ncbi:MAG: helix-turn-helix domain-containing protein [Bythopirellula sp.]
MIRLKQQSYGQFDSGHRVGPATWPHFDLLCLHEGRISLCLQAQHQLEMTQGDAVLIYPHTQFEGDAITATARASVHHFEFFNHPPEAPLTDLAGRCAGFLTFLGPRDAHFRSDVDRLIRLSTQVESVHVATMREALLTILLSQLCIERDSLTTSPPTRTEQFDGLRAWTMDNLHRKLTITDLAKQVGVSESHFRALFRHREGLPAGAFLAELRMTEAQRLLRETRLPIKRVARAVGYSSAVSFYHSFTRSVAMTPAQYRDRKAPRG